MRRIVNVFGISLLNLSRDYFLGGFSLWFLPAWQFGGFACWGGSGKRWLQKGSGSLHRELEAGGSDGCSRLIIDSGWSSARCLRS